MSKRTPIDKLTLDFDLHELPTAQHRAGLAGLILQIDAMGPKGFRRPEKFIPVIEDFTSTSAKITFTPESMQGVFDELYDAKMVEVVVAAKWPGEAKPKPGSFTMNKKDPKTGDIKVIPGFAYDVVQPQAPALMRHLGGGRETWLELWRQMVWTIPRGGNNVRARAPFNDRANHRPCGEGATAWAEAVDFQKRLLKSQFRTEPISGALMLGAQAVNAEGVSFSGRVDHNLLLHFWQLVVLTFVPQVVAKKDAKVERIGYVLAIPDVGDLEEFRDAFPHILQSLEAADPKQTPLRARLDLPAQAGLETLRRLRDESQGAARSAADAPDNSDLVELSKVSDDEVRRFNKTLLAEQRKDRIHRQDMHRALASEKAITPWRRCVRAVETYHMLKIGNNVKLLSFARVANREDLIEQYKEINERYRNPLFRAALMRALLQQRPRHWGMVELFNEYPQRFFLEIEGETPKYIPRFGRDARTMFAIQQQEIREMTPDEMNQDDEVKRLGTIVEKLMTNYVNRRAAKKLGLNWDDFKVEEVDGKKRKVAPDPDKFAEQQRRVCDDAFLQIRSRHDEEFVTFFTDSVISVPQYFNAKAGDLAFLSRFLMRSLNRDPVATPVLNRDDIRTLAMLALSAHSFNIRKRTPNQEGNPA